MVQLYILFLVSKMVGRTNIVLIHSIPDFLLPPPRNQIDSNKNIHLLIPTFRHYLFFIYKKQNCQTLEKPLIINPYIFRVKKQKLGSQTIDAWNTRSGEIRILSDIKYSLRVCSLKVDKTRVDLHLVLYTYMYFFRFTLYPACIRVSKGSLVLKFSAPYSVSNSGGFAFLMA